MYDWKLQHECEGAQGQNRWDLPVVPIGALELIIECQQILAGERAHLTALHDYVAMRRHYWQRANRTLPAAGCPSTTMR